MFFARWLNVKFAVWCDMVITDILVGRAELKVTKPEESAALRMPDFLRALQQIIAALADQHPRISVVTSSCIPSGYGNTIGKFDRPAREPWNSLIN